MSSRHQEGLAHLLYGINQGGGFVALTGEVGTGKTTLCQCLLQQLPEQVDLALVLNPKLSAVDLLATICDELSINYDKYRQTLKCLVDCLNHYLLAAHANGRRTVLMIDEAQNLSFDVLEQVRLLTNLETTKSKLLQIILVGQPELQKMLASEKLRQLNQRITARYHLLPLTETETGLYIKHRLKVSHGDPNLFKTAAIKRIHRLSGGIPRLVNIICDRALLGAYTQDRRRVTVDIVNRAVREIDTRLLIGYQRRRRWLLLGCLLLSVAAAFWYHQPLENLTKKVNGDSDEESTVVVHQEQVTKTTLPVSAETENSRLVEEEQISVGADTVIETQSVEDRNLDLKVFLLQEELSLQQAFTELLQYWELEPLALSECSQLPVNCLADQTSWRALLALNRPAVIELADSQADKHYLLLVAVKDGQPVFRHQGQEIRFPLHEILALWQGFYLLIWQSPLAKVETINPGEQSAAVVWLRQQLDVIQGNVVHGGASDYFDAALQKRVLDFQQTQQLQADGIVGPRTMIHLQNAASGSEIPGPRLMTD